jgi:ribosome-associated protein
MDTISKTQRKREVEALQTLGEELVALSRDRLQQLALPDRLFEAIGEAQRITAHEGRRRQLQYIGRLMRDVDAEPIAAQLQQWRQPGRAEAKLHQQAESWRTQLLNDASALEALRAKYPSVDAARVLDLTAQAQWESAQGKPPKASRALFRLLSDLLHTA